MRIRRNAKLSILYAAKPVQSHACQLNQNPWDVMDLSPPSSPPQVDGDVVRDENRSSLDANRVLDREVVNGGFKPDHSNGNVADKPPEEQCVKDDDNKVILCCKSDGKSWKCRRMAAKGNSLCEHHLSLMRSYSSSNHSKKSAKENPALESQKQPRIKRMPASSSTDPAEFYYYSGFGPWWGKKRGKTRKRHGSMIIEHKHEHAPPQIHLAYIGDDDEDDDEDEEQENGDNEVIRRKRARKPVKARSLKSLM